MLLEATNFMFLPFTAYQRIRSKHSTAVVVFNELYEEFYESWRDEMIEPEYVNVVMDIHLYDWQEPFTCMV